MCFLATGLHVASATAMVSQLQVISPYKAALWFLSGLPESNYYFAGALPVLYIDKYLTKIHN